MAKRRGGGEPGDLAQGCRVGVLVRYMVTPVEMMTAGWRGSKPAGGELRPALGEGIHPGAQDDVLADASARLLGNQILDESSTGEDGRLLPAELTPGSMSGRRSRPSSGAASCRPISSSST